MKKARTVIQTREIVMPTLRLRFRIWLDETSEERFNDHFAPHGPLFHRWLPDGVADALTLQSGDSTVELRVWFERLGYVRDRAMGRDIVFDPGRRELDSAIMATQGILQAGPLCGELVLHALTDEEIAPLREFVTNEQREKSTGYYVRLGKRVVKLIQPPVTHFLDVLRINFGQYWLTTLESWDSRKESLGQYCSHTLNLRWGLDNEDTWERFIPTQLQGRIYATMRPDQHFLEYLSREDWAELQQVVGELKSPSLAARILVQTHRLRDQNDLRYALIEGVTALELALDDYLDHKLAGSTDLSTTMQTFKG